MDYTVQELFWLLLLINLSVALKFSKIYDFIAGNVMFAKGVKKTSQKFSARSFYIAFAFGSLIQLAKNVTTASAA